VDFCTDASACAGGDSFCLVSGLSTGAGGEPFRFNPGLSTGAGGDSADFDTGAECSAGLANDFTCAIAGSGASTALADRVFAVTARCCSSAVRDCPHLRQNLASSRFSTSHIGQKNTGTSLHLSSSVVHLSPGRNPVLGKRPEQRLGPDRSLAMLGAKTPERLFMWINTLMHNH